MSEQGNGSGPSGRGGALVRSGTCPEMAFDALSFEVPVSSPPLRVTELPGRWHPLARWTPEALVSRYGDRLVPLARGRGKDFRYRPDRGIGESPADYEILEVSLAEAVERVKGTREHHRYAMKQVSIERTLPELRKEAPCPAFLDGQGHLSWLWISGDQTRTCLHFDRANGMIVQLQGAKKIILAPPEEADRIPLHPERSASAHGSDFDLASQAGHRLRRFEVVLEAGQALVIPAFWFHQVENLGISVSVHYSWRPSIPQRLLAPARRLSGHDFSANRLRSLRRQLAQAGDPRARAYAAQARHRGDDVAAALVLLADWEERFLSLVPGAVNPEEVFRALDVSEGSRNECRWILDQVASADERPLRSSEAVAILARLAAAPELKPLSSNPYEYLA